MARFEGYTRDLVGHSERGVDIAIDRIRESDAGDENCRSCDFTG